MIPPPQQVSAEAEAVKLFPTAIFKTKSIERV